MDEPRLMMERLLEERGCPQNQPNLYDKRGLISPRSARRSCGPEYHCAKDSQKDSQKEKKGIPQPFPRPISAPYLEFHR